MKRLIPFLALMALSTMAAGAGYLSVLAGPGESHRDWGETFLKVRTVDLIPRYGRVLTGDVLEGWYRFRHEMLVEMPLSLIVDPKTAPMAGLNVLACFSFPGLAPARGLTPYFQAGGGVVYVGTPLEGMGRRLNGNYQSGAGLRYAFRPGIVLSVEARLHHISNMGTADPNFPLNSTKFLGGITFEPAGRGGGR